QGFGLSSTTGLAGFPNGEAQKSDFLYPHYHTARLFLRHTFGLGGEQETVESDANQLSGKRDVSRVTVQAGRLPVKDVFDNNTYDIGVFGRWSWNNGRNEMSAFTDINASLSFGTAIKGTAWGRPDDAIGIAGAVNALSQDYRDYLAAGGLGILVGDGQLNYRT